MYYFRDIFQNLHDRPNFPIHGWSKDALLVRSIAFKFLDSTEYWEKTFAEQFTLWTTLFQYRYENYKPSACEIGKVNIYLIQNFNKFPILIVYLI